MATNHTRSRLLCCLCAIPARPSTLRRISSVATTITRRSAPSASLRTSCRAFSSAARSCNSKSTSSPQEAKSTYTQADVLSAEILFDAINEKLFAKTTGDKAKLPTEREVIAALRACQQLASSPQTSTPTSSESTVTSPTNAVLSLSNAKPKPRVATRQNQAITSISAKEARAQKEYPPIHPIVDMAYHIISHPFVFISAPVLDEYVKIADITTDPSTLPSVLHQYAYKPTLSSPKATPTPSNPNSQKNAVPLDIAYAALDVAITAKNMPIALTIIDRTTSTSAYCRLKALQKLLPFATLCGALPFALYRLAEWLAGYQDLVIHERAVGLAFTGFMAYTFMTGTLGMVALLTWNDHMVRVTWMPGVLLRERWFMEEQRMMADKVAMAWGFDEVTQRGFESGWEWEMLKDWAGVKGMLVDMSELIEGKEISAEKLIAKTKSLQERKLIKS